MLSRRSFLNGTLGAAAGLTMQGPQQMAAQAPAVQGGRRRRIVDAQVHLWKAETPDRPWVPGMVPQLPEPFTIEKLSPMMDEAGVDRVVIVPPSWEGDRVDYALEAAKRHPDRFAVMGRIPAQESAIRRSPAVMERSAGNARASRHVSRRASRMAHGWDRGLVLAGSREGRPSRHVPDQRETAGIRAHR